MDKTEKLFKELTEASGISGFEDEVADIMAGHLKGVAKINGVDVSGPIDAHGERIYYATAPGGLSVSFQSRLGQADV